MNLESIANKLAADGVGAIGVDIFINNMPTTATTGVLLRPPYVGTPIDFELPNYRVTKFTAAARAPTYQVAHDLAWDVINSLTLLETTLPGMDIRYIRPRTEPVVFPASDGGLVEFLMLFDAVYVIVP